jgi:uncharacterized protein with ParB-like and HNH nuclease domain
MGNKLKINTDDLNLRDLLGNGKKYRVPKFQRDYSWGQEQWQDLWEDIEFIHENVDEYHYMGYLVLQEKDDSVFSVIDGQQRFTTFSLIVLAAIKRLKEINDEERANLLLRTFIGTEDLTYLTIENKLTLNRNNDYYYNQAVSGQPIPKRSVNKTTRLMHDALDFFYENFCHEQFSQGEKINALIGNVARKTLFTTIFIGDELNAYKVFETLNARGVRLSSADLLKNYLFSTIDISQDMPDKFIDKLDEQWEKIGVNIFGKNYTDYLLTEWNSRHKKVRQNLLFKSIKKEITNDTLARKYLNQLSSHCYLYAALINPEEEFWKDFPEYKEIKRDLLFLKMFGISQPISLLFSSCLNFKSEFHRILKWITNLSLRYNVICREHTGEQENLYSKICVDIQDGCGIQEIKQKLLTLYPNDERFKSDFTEKTFPTKQSNKKARYLLARLEEYNSNNSNNSAVDESKLTVEHILPEEPDNHWCEYFGENYAVFNQRLGNMALVSSQDNMAQEPFSDKRPKISQTKYQINDINSYSDWDEDAINSRQSDLADIAVLLWKIQ